MRIVIIGPTLVTKNCLKALLKVSKDKIVGLFTLHESYADEKSRYVIFDKIAKENNIPLFKVMNINNRKNVEMMKKLNPDVIFQLGWSQIMSEEILKIPPKGCIGVHASLLPESRGGASLNWALIKNMKKTGVTLFYLNEKVDSGNIIAQKEFYIDFRDDIRTLHDKSDLASIELILENLDSIRDGTVKSRKQDESKASYTKQRKAEDGIIDWNSNCMNIYNWIRALAHPFPGAFTYYKGKKLFIWQADLTRISENSGEVGEIIDIIKKGGILVKTKDKEILLRRVQIEDGIEMWADDFAEKYKIKKGIILGK